VGLIIRPEESYRLWCFFVCGLETSRRRKPYFALGRRATWGGGGDFYMCNLELVQLYITIFYNVYTMTQTVTTMKLLSI
jgi:hypothetical protein